MKLNPRRFGARFKWHTFETKHVARSVRREREFLKGAPLVLIPAMLAFPAWIMLVHNPRFHHSGLIAGIVAVAFVAMIAIGLRKLVRCICWRELDLIGAMCFGVFLVLFVMVLYGCMFFFLYSSARID